jgi:beta-xylosidase
VSEDIIKTVNLDKGVFGLQENIDLKNWNLWFSWLWTNENNLKNKQKFAEFVNIMLSGTVDKPINIDSIWAMWNVTFIWEEEKIIGYADASTNIANKILSFSDPKSFILWNMEKFRNPSEGKK